LDWTDYEKEDLTEMFEKVQSHLLEKGFKGKFPDPIRMLKTTGEDDIRECNGYCRSNTICADKNSVTSSFGEFWVHELFHIFSQNNPELINRLYNSIGFFRCNEIELPENINKNTITNPDAPKHDVYIEVIHKDKTIKVTPVVFYNKENNGSFFSALYIRLVQIELEHDKYVCSKDDNGECIMLDVKDVSNFYEQIGNSYYYFHPDEILATRFGEMYTRELTKKNSSENITHDKYEQLMNELLFEK
jgi:hypothetical protein